MGAAALAGRLGAMGLELRLVSGDAPERAARMAEAAGIGAVHAGMRPEDEAAPAAAHAWEGLRVLMIGGALDGARAASDVVLLGGGLEAVPDLLHEARAADRRIRENLASAGLQDLVAVPLAVLGLAPLPIAAIAMFSSSPTVVLNALQRPRA